MKKPGPLNFWSIVKMVPITLLITTSLMGYGRQIKEGMPNVAPYPYLTSAEMLDKLALSAINGDSDAWLKLAKISLETQPGTLAEATVILVAQTSSIRVQEFFIINATNPSTLSAALKHLEKILERKRETIAWAIEKTKISN
jgi:hypothetical protein